MVKVSIIVPVYNVEKYLEKCLESLIDQTLKDIEIICVNDGSTDNSLGILKNFANKDSRIKIIDKQNEGVSVARNTGIEVATGQYLMFVDSDDYLIENACEKALNTIEQEDSDICIFGHYDLVNENKIISHKTNDLMKIKDLKIKENLVEHSIYIWDKIYRTEFIKSNHIKFPLGLKTAEDVIFCLLCLFNDAKYSTLAKPLYVYRIDTNGNSATSNVQNIKNDIIAFETLYNLQIFKEQPLSLQLQVVNRFCGGCLYYYEKFKNTHSKLLKLDISNFLNLVETYYNQTDLMKFKRYRDLKNLNFREFLKSLFSITNSFDKQYKVIRFLGTSFKFKRVNKTIDDKRGFSIIIPTLQKNKYVLNKLISQLVEDNNVSEIIIIDNSKKGFEYNSSKVNVYIPKNNLFVNGAWNLGVTLAKNKYIGILNDDIILPKNLCTEVFLFIISNPQVGLIGANSDKVVFSQEYDFQTFPPKQAINFNVQTNDVHTKFWGIAIFGPKENFFQIPRNLKIYCGDNYLLKKNCDKGKTCYQMSNATIKHLGSNTSKMDCFNKIKAQDVYNYSKIDNRFISHCNYQKQNSLLENLFSIKNSIDKKHKVITILGVKFNVNRKVRRK